MALWPFEVTIRGPIVTGTCFKFAVDLSIILSYKDVNYKTSTNFRYLNTAFKNLSYFLCDHLKYLHSNTHTSTELLQKGVQTLKEKQ